MTDRSDLPFRAVHFAPRDIDVVRRSDGSILLHPRMTVTLREAHFPAYLRRHAARRPHHPWLGQRRPKGGQWRKVTFGEALDHVNSLTQALLDLKIAPGKALAILSENSLEQALIALAAMQAKIPVAPVSPAYSLQSRDFVKLREVMAVVNPGVFFVQNGAKFSPALAALGVEGAPIISVDDVGPGQLDYSDLIATIPTSAVDASVAAINPDEVARIMFTSGSTGSPKGVPQTHKNLVVAAESNLQTNGHDAEGELARLDWTPWSHVFGATGLGLALVSGGTMMIDDGRPVEGLFDETIRNLREFSPTTFVTVPSAYGMLVNALEKDDELARSFFKRLDMIGYGAASLPADLVHRLQALAARHIGCKIPITCGYGATETGPGGAFIYWPTDRTGLIGLPHAGFDMKLVPLDDGRYEVRIRGDAVMSGYVGRPDLNSQIFDEEGFYKIGDTVRLADPADLMEGLVFAGRLSEEFKLQTGTFVLVGSLRLALLESAKPLLSDVVICGENQAYVAIMAWLNLEEARKFSGRPEATRVELNADPVVRGAVKKALGAHNQRNPGVSLRVERFLLMDDPPSVDLGEITDKGSINQRGVQRHRAALVETLFAAHAGIGVSGVSS